MPPNSRQDDRLLKIPRPLQQGQEKDGDFVLLYVSRDGPAELDLKLLATEGTTPFVGSVKQNALSKWRTQNLASSDEEWKQILSKVLLCRRPSSDHESVSGNLDVAAAVKDGQMTITLRRNISGITQRLGSLVLRQDDDQEIELFDWAGVAAETAARTEDGVVGLETRLKRQQDAITLLNQRLEDLIKAKEEHEIALLEKCCQLLNSKKLKIRDQQRLLKTAKLDPETGTRAPFFTAVASLMVTVATEIKATRKKNLPRKAILSRARKRKAAPEDPSQSPETSDPDAMDVDAADPDHIATPDPDASPQATPEPSDEDTADEEDGHGELPPPAPSSDKGKPPESSVEEKNSALSAREMPPRRQLPFETKSPTATQAEKPLQPSQPPGKGKEADDDDTSGESDDDEL
ncbi:MAG: hypothetical protein M1826_002669 [Phylliscum demangeonii]|nr:MAG: hypothetical protein M1826_002669 [Phylliscum demangeonii]